MTWCVFDLKGISMRLIKQSWCAWMVFSVMVLGMTTALSANAQSKPVKHAKRIQLATGAALGPDGRLWVVGLNEQGQMFVQSSPAQALGQWTAPVILNTQQDEIAADGESRPKMAFGPNGWAVVTYTQPLPKPYTGFVRMLRSADGGQTFSAPFTVHQDRQEITHRFESILFDAQGNLHTLWIDKRDMPAKGAGPKYIGAAVYGNVSKDGGATFGPDYKLADHSCECCRIAMSNRPDGKVAAVWRHVFGEQTRDHAFAVLPGASSVASSSAQGQSKPPVRSTFDDWQINACPHHGPGLAAITSQTGFHMVWFGIRKQDGQDVPGVRYARLNANGEPLLSSVKALPDARAEHADVLAHKQRVVVVWRSSEGSTSTLKAWVSENEGQSFSVKVLGQTQGPNDHPRLVQHAEKMLVVWRDTKEIKVYDVSQ
jgi:hypothetical protein